MYIGGIKMQVVADIDDNLYTRLFDNGKIDAVDMLKVCSVVRKGTPLPKGHGKLIDADALYADLIFPTQQFAKAFHETLDDAQTIIPAEKENT
jgi:hypothetical protein